MVMRNVSTSTTGTTHHTNTRMEESENCFVAQVKKSSLEHGKGMPVSCGGSSKIIQVKKESTVRCSETSRPTLVQNSFVKRMRLLTQYGLVKGIIPSSMRRGSGQLTLDAVLLRPDGGSAEKLK